MFVLIIEINIFTKTNVLSHDTHTATSWILNLIEVGLNSGLLRLCSHFCVCVCWGGKEEKCYHSVHLHWKNNSVWLKRERKTDDGALTLQRSERFIRRCLCLGWSWDAPAGWKSGCRSRWRSVVTGRTQQILDPTWLPLSERHKMGKTFRRVGSQHTLR